MLVQELYIDMLCKSQTLAIAKVHSCQMYNGCLYVFCAHPSGEEGFGHGNACYKCCIQPGVTLPPENHQEVLRVMFPVNSKNNHSYSIYSQPHPSSSSNTQQSPTSSISQQKSSSTTQHQQASSSSSTQQ